MLTKKNAILAAIIFVCIISVFYVLSGNGPGGQTGYNAIKTGIGNSLSKQRDISSKVGELGTELDGSINTAGKLEQTNSQLRDAIESIERENASLAAIIKDNRERLTKCQQIVDRMEKGTGQENSSTK